ncbi:MAG TPA: ParA family protein [Lachnospiraceae bacterium]|nr:ParA family protein [Lachnospiraceae bacterium]
MALKSSYAVWNNKGGVGKSTITFHLSMRYAEKNPETKVLVIDLCPQSNSSMMLLGGGTKGDDQVLEFCSFDLPKSVVGYTSTVITNGRGAKLPNPYDFVLHVKGFNENVPDNLFLLCGDGNMEPMAPAINEAANAKPLTPSAQPWKWVLEIFRRFINDITSGEDDWVVFVDTNPSFSIYTQMAVSAVDKLLTPINADDSSKTAASAMMALLHGTNPPHPIYGSWTFAEMAKQQHLSVPRIHLLIGNRLTQFEGPAMAFEALSDATAAALYNIYCNNPEYFATASKSIDSIEEFRDYYSVPLRDFNTAGVVCGHLGRLLSSMKQGYYNVYSARVKVNAEKISECLKAIDEIIDRL